MTMISGVRTQNSSLTSTFLFGANAPQESEIAAHFSNPESV